MSRSNAALDEEQRAAGEADDDVVAVLAGPGSGKTRTLAHRARYLLAREPSTRALLLTFTNKAAAEMKARAVGAGGIGMDRVTASTFHTFGARTLRSHGAAVGIASDFQVLDQDENEQLASEVAASEGVANLLDPWTKRRLRRESTPEAVQAFGDLYEAAKRREGVVDYADLIVYTTELLVANEALARAYGTRYAHLLVDEFQDTSPAQFAIIEALAPHVRSISVFADDDQAIFGFAGADARNVGRFVERLGAQCYPLTTNYRSRAEIVDCANKLIAASPMASGRVMSASRSGGVVEAVRYIDEAAEAEMVAEDISAAIADGAAPASFAVLARDAFRPAAIAAALLARQVPLSDWRTPKVVPEERRALVACMAVTRGRLTDRHADRLAGLLGVDAFEERDTETVLAVHDGHPVAGELAEVRRLAFASASVATIVSYAQSAIAESDSELADRITPIVQAVADFERHDPEYTLEHLLDELALRSGVRPPTESGGVKLATLHATKGLQWPTVYLIGLEEGGMPHYRSTQEDEIDADRRTCFVGVCRAEERLVLTCAARTKGRARGTSRFLREMGID